MDLDTIKKELDDELSILENDKSTKIEFKKD
jgi:hypothetical protein